MPKITKAQRKEWADQLAADFPLLLPLQIETMLCNYEHSADWMIAEMKRKQRQDRLASRTPKLEPVHEPEPVPELQVISEATA